MLILSSVRRALALLSKRDRRVVIVAALLQVSLSILDLVGVLLLGVVAALAASSVTGESLNPVGSSILGTLPQFETQQVLALATFAGVLLVSKSVVSLFLTRRVFRFLANRQALLAGSIAERYLSRPVVDMHDRSSQEAVAALTTGVNAITIGTLGPAIVIVAETSLVVTMTLGLVFVDPFVAIFSLAYFSLVVVVLQKLLGHWAQSLGTRQTTAEIGGMVALQEALSTYRESSVLGRRAHFVNRFKTWRWEAASVLADTYILNQVAKYVFEVSLVLGGGLLILSTSVSRSLPEAVAILTVFLAASSRIFPSLLRLQTAMGTIRNASGLAKYTFSLVESLQELENESPSNVLAEPLLPNRLDESTRESFVGNISCKDLWLNYPSSSKPVLRGVSLEVVAGQSIAIVGKTGAGKSTLADVLLGVIPPTSGQVEISGLPPSDVINRWPGLIAYVPQQVRLLDASIRDNVALGVARDAIDDQAVWEALDRAHMKATVIQEGLTLDDSVGENGFRLSGGQVQRLGIARALYSRPQLLVLDEATSSLDAATEHAIGRTIDELAGQVTTVIIAHRLATVRKCDAVLYLEAGLIIGRGTFEDVRASVPEFDRQARISGL